MSYVNRRRGRWQAAYRGPDGRERTKTFDRKVDAERWLTNAEADLLRGTWVDPAESRTTLADYSARWLERMTPTWRPATAGSVRISLDKHILPALGRHRLSALRRSDVEALCARLELAPSTVYVVYQHLYQVLSAAVEDGLLARNPAARARLPKREASKAQPVPLELVERIASQLPDWMKVVVPLGVGAGLRQGEVCGLTADRVDLERRRLRVDRQLVSRYVPEPVLGPPKTASSHRTVPLASFVVEALEAHLERFPAEPGQPIVRMPSGLWVDSDRFGHPWRTACRHSGGRGIRYHDLRHTFASILLSRGVSVKAVADWLGHASPKITLDTYAHLMPADEEVARGVLDAALDPFSDQLAADSRGLFADTGGRAPPLTRADDPLSALEEELGFFLVQQQAQLVGQVGVVAEAGVGVDDLDGGLPRPRHQVTVTTERRQLQVVPALLTRSQDGALAPDVEILLGQPEAVGRGHQGLEPALTLLGLPRA